MDSAAGGQTPNDMAVYIDLPLREQHMGFRCLRQMQRIGPRDGSTRYLNMRKCIIGWRSGAPGLERRVASGRR